VQSATKARAHLAVSAGATSALSSDIKILAEPRFSGMGVHVPVYSKRLHASRANPGSGSSTEAIMILLHSHSGHQLTAESGKCMSARAKELPLNVVAMFLLHTAQAKGTIISWGRKSSRP
jgi:hypothetical protein